MSKIRKILPKFKWFGFGTSGQNQNSETLKTRKNKLRMISDFQNLHSLKIEAKKHANMKVIFSKNLHPVPEMTSLLIFLWPNFLKFNFKD